METVDARGLACPQPVILARRAMVGGQPVQVLVDNQVAVDNLTRMARSAGWNTAVRQTGTRVFEVDLRPDEARVEEAVAAPTEAKESGSIVVLLASDRIGEGDAELGALLMRAFLHTLTELEPRPHHVICMNAGVRLAADGSPVLEDLSALTKCGVAIWLCGTCVDYYRLKDTVRVGTISNMYSIAELLLNAGRVIRP